MNMITRCFPSLAVAVAMMSLMMPSMAMAQQKKEAVKPKGTQKWRAEAQPIHLAAFDNDLPALKKALSAKDVNIDVRLSYKSFADYTSLHLAAYEGHGKVIEALAGKGADLNAIEKTHKRTPLHLAAATGRLEAVRALIKAGADLKIKDKHGNTPMSMASDKAVIAEFKKAGATE